MNLARQLEHEARERGDTERAERYRESARRDEEQSEAIARRMNAGDADAAAASVAP
jgi:hypothetical protein